MSHSVTPPQFAEVDVNWLRQKLDSDSHPIQLIDVREPQEIAIASIPGFQSFPLSQYGDWEKTIGTVLDPHVETYVLCHHGIRSAQMCAWLIHQGFILVSNVIGGIDAYSMQVDSKIPRY